MKLIIISIGKVKDRQLLALISNYKKKIAFDAKVVYHEIKDTTIEKEAEIIQKYVDKKENTYVIACSEDGNSLDSKTFADTLKRESVNNKTIIFIVGGPFGLSENVKDEADLVLSLSKMTFTHEMFQLFLLEQLYRAISIIKNKSYHK